MFINFSFQDMGRKENSLCERQGGSQPMREDSSKVDFPKHPIWIIMLARLQIIRDKYFC